MNSATGSISNAAEVDRDEGWLEDEVDEEDDINLEKVPISDVTLLTDLVASVLAKRGNAPDRMREQAAIMYMDLIPAEGDGVTVDLYRRFLAQARLDERIRTEAGFQIGPDDQGLHSQRFVGNLDPRLVTDRVELRNGVVVQKVSIEMRR